MDKENVAHLHIWVLLNAKKQGHLEFSIKCMELESTILSDVSQAQKDEYGMYSLKSEN